MSRFHTIILVIPVPEEGSEPRCIWPVGDAGWSATPPCTSTPPLVTHCAVHKLLRVVFVVVFGCRRGKYKRNANFSLIMSQELPVTCSKSVSSFKIPKKCSSNTQVSYNSSSCHCLHCFWSDVIEYIAQGQP